MGSNDDRVGVGDITHRASTSAYFVVTVLGTNVICISVDLVHCPFCCWGASGERDVEWVGSGGRGMKEDE